MLQNTASDQGLHCLYTEILSKVSKNDKSTPDIPKIVNELIQLPRMDQSIR